MSDTPIDTTGMPPSQAARYEILAREYQKAWDEMARLRAALAAAHAALGLAR